MLGLPRATWSAAAEGEVMMEEVEMEAPQIVALLTRIGVGHPWFFWLVTVVAQMWVINVIFIPHNNPYF
jgi:hypothetical protein